ncbi:unnamed protein product, partial [Staurois parvus]
SNPLGALGAGEGWPYYIMVHRKNVPYIGGQWEECHYIGGQWEECSLHWRLVRRMLLTLVVSGKNDPYIGGQWEECPYIGDQ